MKYPYFRGLEADRYSFYRVPKALIKVDLFEKMSGDAKLLYAVLLDRMNLSLKNGWQDENGNAYIICTIDEIMDSIRCARQKAVKLLDELEHEYQLIERRRQGLGKPNLLYVKDLYAGLSQSNYWKYENQTSGGLKSELPGVYTVTPTRLQLRVMLVHGMRLMKRRSAARSSSCWSMRNTGMKLPALRSMSRENWWQKICGTALMRISRMP